MVTERKTLDREDSLQLKTACAQEKLFTNKKMLGDTCISGI